jgi:hypothetical protein
MFSYSQELVDVLGGHGMSTGPDLGRLDGLQIKPGDDTKVAASTLQSPEQIRVAGLVGFNNRAIGQNNLVVNNGITTEADLVAVEVDTTSQEQSRNTDGTETATSCGKSEPLQVCVDIGPSRQK